MSEYQYYEFVAIDEPLTAKQMAALRAWSSRARITPTRFVNHYEWGDLKGDPVDWMWRYFDAHVYVANWGTCLLYLRLPKNVFDAKALQPFKTGTNFSVRQTKAHWLFGWGLGESEDYDRFGEEDGKGWMGRLMPLRDELLRGDLRPLYLGWLAGVSRGELKEATIEPPPPPGLSRLTAAQRALAEFLEIDGDLLAAAGLADGPETNSDDKDDSGLDTWIAALASAENAAAIKLLLTGKGQQAERDFKKRFLAWQRGQLLAKKPQSLRTVVELRTLAASAAEIRKKQETVQRKKAAAARRAKRETYLRTLSADFDRYWKTADTQAERGVASAYDEVKRIFVDLSEAYALCATRSGFDRKLHEFMKKHEKRGALVRRLADAGLLKKPSR